MMKLKILINVFLLLLLIFTGCQKPDTIQTSTSTTSTTPPDAKIVCLFFDDGYKNQHDAVWPILQHYNYKATFGIITGDIGFGVGLMQYMSLEELKSLANDGMDIASHSISHPHLLTLSDEAMRAEIFDSKKDLEDLGFVVKTFVTPFYEWNDQVVEYIIAANYTCGRGGWTINETFNPSTTDPKARYHVSAWSITNQDIKSFKAIVDKAGPNAVVCLVYHFITDSGPVETSTPLANFQAQMGYLKSEGFTVVLLPDLFNQ